MLVEVCSFHIFSYLNHSYLNFFRRAALRQKPFFKGDSIKNLHTINNPNKSQLKSETII